MQSDLNGPLRPAIKVHGEYLGNLEQRARAQRTLAEKESLERAHVSATRVLELVPRRINWFESNYGEWLATGAEAVWGYLDASLPQSWSSSLLRPNSQTHKNYLDHLKMRKNALHILGGTPKESAEAKANKTFEIIERFESRYAEWLATGAEAVWGYLDAPLPGRPEMP